MMKNKLLIIFISLFMFFTLTSEAKEPKDTISGAYQYPLSNNYDNRYPAGYLEVLKVSKDKIKFWVYCVLGLPSLNQGELRGVAVLKNDRAIFKDDENGCEIIFIFKEKLVEVKVIKLGYCGYFGHNVTCEGTYKLKSRKLENITQDQDIEK